MIMVVRSPRRPRRRWRPTLYCKTRSVVLTLGCEHLLIHSPEVLHLTVTVRLACLLRRILYLASPYSIIPHILSAVSLPRDTPSTTGIGVCS